MNQHLSMGNPTPHAKCGVLSNQHKKILPDLMSPHGLTALESSIHHGITSLHRRLTELRELGCVIEFREERSAAARYNRYYATLVPKSLRKQLRQEVVA